ncbi:MAG: hypothetical protein QF785_05595 [Phycisphaeraceae bacterium]|nr:hypothetical protein [Phycisphaeraceae bacterium]
MDDTQTTSVTTMMADDSSDSGQPARRALVLVGDPADAPRALLDGLTSRGVEPVMVDDAVQVMMQLAQLIDESSTFDALIVDSSVHVGQQAELIGAVKRYYPTVICRQFHDRGDSVPPVLTEIEVCERTLADEATAPAHTATPASEPDVADSEAERSGSLLTQEELDMLLDDSIEPNPDETY